MIDFWFLSFTGLKTLVYKLTSCIDKYGHRKKKVSKSFYLNGRRGNNKDIFSSTVEKKLFTAFWFGSSDLGSDACQTTFMVIGPFVIGTAFVNSLKSGQNQI